MGVGVGVEVEVERRLYEWDEWLGMEVLEFEGELKQLTADAIGLGRGQGRQRFG